MTLRTKDRKPELCCLNVLMCLFVVLVHVLSDAVSRSDPLSWQFAAVAVIQRLCHFAVQGFIFLSGLRLCLKPRIDWKKFYLRRFTAIVLPYLIWNVVYYACYILRGWYVFDLGFFLQCLCRGTMASHFYYIVIAVQFYLLLPVTRWLLERVNPALLVLCALGATLFLQSALWQYEYNDRIFTAYLVYWVLGCAAGKHYEKFSEMLDKNRVFIFAAYGVFAAAEGILSWLNLSGRYFVYGLDVLGPFYCIAAVLFFLTLFRAFTAKRELPGFIATLDKISYGVYLSHMLILVFADELMTRLGVTAILPTLALRFVLVFGVTILGNVVYCLCKEKLAAGRISQ